MFLHGEEDTLDVLLKIKSRLFYFTSDRISDEYIHIVMFA